MESVFYFDSKGRKYKGRVRVCEKCGNEEIVRDNNLGKVCLKCKRSYREIIYYSKGKKYTGRVRKCLDCGKKETVRLSNNAKYCSSCSQKHKKSCVKDNEVFVIHGKARQRGYKIKCPKCGLERIVRNDFKYKTKLCKHCSTSEIYKKIGKETGPLKYKNGIGSFRKKALKYFSPKCFICKEENIKKIDVHHIDQDRTNNDITNLIPLCKSCHRYIHNYLRKGLIHKEAIEAIKLKKKEKNTP